MPGPLLTGHTQRIRGALELSDGRLLTWSDYGNARLWGANGVPGPVLTGHASVGSDMITVMTSGVVGGRQLDDGRILTIGRDGTARIWNPDGNPGPVLEHDGPVTGALELRDGRLLTWSGTEARIWSSKGTPGPRLRGHQGFIAGALQLVDGRIITWSDDSTARLWQPDPEKLLIWADRVIHNTVPLSRAARCRYYLDPAARCGEFQK